MRTMAGVFGAALLLAATGAGAEPLLKMDAKTQARLGVATVPLAAAHRGASATGFARVLDPVPLATLESDLSAAEAAAAASQAEAARTRALNAADQTVSKQTAEAAQAQARADAAKLRLLRLRVGLEWGPGLARMSDARRAKLVADIAAGRAALLRIDTGSGGGPQARSASLDLGGGRMVRAAVLGPARTGDPRLQTTGVLAMVTGPAALELGSGMVTPASLGGGSEAGGVVIPREALMRGGGQTFVFVRKDAESFERRTVTGGAADPAGLFVTGGFRPGEAVVTRGASQLFAAQTAPAGGEKDD